MRCQVTTTNLPEEALRLVKENDYDYLVTDMKMPVMDGLELIRSVSSLQLSKPPEIIAISGGVSNDYEQLVKESEILAFVSKPFRSIISM